MEKPDISSMRFYGILDTGYVSRENWVSKCNALLEGGSDMIELRAKGANTDEICRLIERIYPLFEDSSVPLIINDDLQAALRFPGLGLHVGQDDMCAEEARIQLGPDRILGVSTHSPGQAHAALDDFQFLDYFAVGPVYATNTKPDYEPVGLELITHVSKLTTPLPFFAIGGINRQTLPAVLEAGAKRVVVVSEALLAEDTAAVVREIRETVVSSLKA